MRNAGTLQKALEQTGLLVVVEDHWIEGGLGDAVLAAVTEGGREMRGQVLKLAVTQMPGSASPEEQRQLAGIDAASITEAVRNALKMTSNDRRRQQLDRVLRRYLRCG